MSILTILNIPQANQIGTTSSSQFEVEGGVPTFDEIPFRVNAGCRPSLNTFAVILNQHDENSAHYGRVISGSELNLRASPGDLQRGEAYGMPRRDIRSSDQAPDLVRTMKIETLGELRVTEGRLYVLAARQLPQTGQAVYELPATAISTLLGTPGPDMPTRGLYLGDVVSGEQIAAFRLPNPAIARHIAILGKTGVGKSYAAGVLIEELFAKRIPIISFDVLGDTEGTAHDLGGRHILAGTEGLRIPYSIVGLEEFLAFVPSLSPDQRELISTAYGMIYQEAQLALDNGELPDIPYDKFLDTIRTVGTQIGSRATDNAVNRARAALERSVTLTDRTIDWPMWLADTPLLNIYVGHMGQFQRNLVLGAAARILQRLRRLAAIPPFVMILDEAHLFLPSGELSTSTRVLREMIRTARHDAIGIVLISQSPSSFDRQVLMTCNTRIVFALDPEDLRVVAGQIGDLPQETIDRIPRMSQGNAVISSGMDIMRHPVVIRIRQRQRTHHGAETPDLFNAVQLWRESRIQENVTLDQSTYSFDS